MALSLVGIGGFQHNSGNAPSASLPGSIAEGDIVIAGNCLAISGGTLADITTSGYGNQTRLSNNGGTASLAVEYKVMGATPDSTVVGSASGNTANYASVIGFQCWRGQDTSTPYDATPTTASGGSGDPNPASIVTVTDGAVVIAWHGSSTLDATVGAPTNYTDEDEFAGNLTNDAVVGYASRLIASATTEDPGTFDYTPSADWACITVAIRPAAGGAPTGNGNLAAANSNIDGEGKSGSTGNGALNSQNATMSGSGRAAWLGSGNLVAQDSDIAGSGTSQSRGNGNLAAQSSTIAGSGRSSSSGNGALVAQNSDVDGSGIAHPLGNGNLVAQNADVDGSGRSFSQGNGSLAAQNAQIAGSGSAEPIGNGNLVAQNADIDGSGRSFSQGNGNLSAQASQIDGSGRSFSQGNGNLASGNADIDGSGVVTFADVTGNGNLIAQNSTLAGSGVSKSLGSGSLILTPSVVGGTGFSASYGNGNLVANDSQIDGSGSGGAGPAPSGDVTAPFVYRMPRRMRAQKRRAA